MKQILIFMILAFSSTSFGINICNNFNKDQYISVAYYQGGSFLSKGWYLAEAKTCKSMNFGQSGQQFYLYYEDGKGAKSLGTYPFCVGRPGPFTIQYANQRASQGQCKWEKYAQINLPSNGTLHLGQKDGGNAPDPKDPPSKDEEWIGEVYYEGGILRNHVLDLGDFYQSSTFRLDFSTCPENTEILRLEARVNGKWVAARRSGDIAGAFSFLDEILTNQLRISLNGSVNDDDLPCYAPVYAIF